jgi:hypothetical protein
MRKRETNMNSKRSFRGVSICVYGVLVAALCVIVPLRLLAQTAPGAKGAKSGSTTAKTAADAKSNASNDAQERARIMASTEWKQVSSEYAKWLSTQAIYSPEEIQRISKQVQTQFETRRPTDTAAAHSSNLV